MAQLDVLADRYAGSKDLLKTFKKATVTSFSEGQLDLVIGNKQLTVQGVGFGQSADGTLDAGTVTGLLEREKGNLVLSIGGLAIPATDFERILTKGSSKKFDDAAFSGDDTMNGGDERDSLDGGSGNDRLSGGPDNDTLDGGDGDDLLDGGAGDDTMDGGDGNDTYIVDSAGDRVKESKDGGNDTIESSVSYTLGGEVETLILTGGSAIDGTGDKSDNTLIGNSGANTLDGAAGDDLLDGGAGMDELIGGKGADHFVVATLVGGADTILDFDVGEGDVLDLSRLLDYYSPESSPDGFIVLSGSGKATEVFVKANADSDFAPAVTVFGNMGLDLQTLVDQGVIVLQRFE